MNERIKELLKLELNQVFFFKNKEYHFYNDILLENFKLGVQIATSILSNNNGWISIDDDTPKIKGRYLCYYPKSDKQAVEPFMLDDMLNNKEYMKALGISHWQPTPPNPTKE